MIDGIPCAYCGHPAVHHVPDRCFTDVPGITGWRECTCTGYSAGEEA